MLHRHGVGKVNHLSVKQLWSQEVVQCFGVQVDRVPRVENPADLLTHSVSFPVAESQLARLNMYRDGLGSREHPQALSLFLLETFCRQPEEISSMALGEQRAGGSLRDFDSAPRPCPRLSSMQRARREGGCRNVAPNPPIHDGDISRTDVCMQGMSWGGLAILAQVGSKKYGNTYVHGSGAGSLPALRPCS